MNFNEVIKDAIELEESLYELYMNGVSAAETSGAKLLFQKLADEELKHKKLLESVNPNLVSNFPDTEYQLMQLHLQISSVKKLHFVKDILHFATKKEAKAYNFYSGIVKKLPFGTMQGVFDKIAAEELKHRNLVTSEFEKMR